jgi:hypothetical protein
MILSRRLRFAAGFLFLLCGIAQAQSARMDTYQVGEANGDFRLDGVLDEPFWQSTPALPLTQQAPRPGQPTPYVTTVRVAATRENIYIAFECTDPSPGQIAVHTMQRDGEVDTDDFVSIVLDTYGDRRTGYFFRINAAGARVDGLVAGPEFPSLDWNGIWDARTQRTPQGWTAEFVIPTRTLNFTKGLDRWGANFERNIARDRTVLRWTSPTLDSFFYDLSRAGTITGLGELEQGLGLEFSPYYAARMRTFFQDRDAQGNSSRTFLGAPGGDITYRLTSQMQAVFTANTDFAETEVDTRQLNITRFELFFPERRTFFLEGSNQYQFGLGLDSQFIPFFSRRVGLFQGAQIPINAGIKLNGRAGRWNIGLLDVQTRDSSLRSGQLVPGTNLFASRVSYDVTPKLRLGAILTNGSPDGVARNTLAGFDGLWRTSEFRGNKNLLIGVWAARSFGDRLPGNVLPPEAALGSRSGYGFKIDYPNDRWDCFVFFAKYGEALEAGLGFLPRPGVRRYDGVCEWRPRPRKDGPFAWVRQQFMDHRFLRVVNYLGQVETQRFTWTPLNLQFETGDRLAVNWIPSYEFLPRPFEISEGLVLPVGKYRFDRFGAEFETSGHRVMQFTNATWFGTFYNGRLFQQQNGLVYTDRQGRWQTGVNIEQNFGRLAQGSFIQRLWALNLTYAVNPNLVLTSFLQYDTESSNVGNNLRLRWTIKPGNEFFIVWNRGWRRLYMSPNDIGVPDPRTGMLSLIPDTEVLAIKLRWTIRR